MLQQPPLFWRYVDLEDDHRVDRLLTSSATLNLLAKNAPFVRTLKADLVFLSYYLEGMMRSLNEQEEEQRDETMRPHGTTASKTTTNTRILLVLCHQ